MLNGQCCHGIYNHFNTTYIWNKYTIWQHVIYEYLIIKQPIIVSDCDEFNNIINLIVYCFKCCRYLITLIGKYTLCPTESIVIYVFCLTSLICVIFSNYIAIRSAPSAPSCYIKMVKDLAHQIIRQWCLKLLLTGNITLLF